MAKVIRDSGRAQRRISAKKVAELLGAERVRGKAAKWLKTEEPNDPQKADGRPEKDDP